MSEIKPVLIVGAGPTGMTAAMELARFGVPVRIVDKLLTPSTTSRALAVQARTLELFEQRGLTNEMLRIGNQGNAATLYSEGKCLGKVHLKAIKSRYNYILLLSQGETERILREQLARQNISIERGTEMIAFAQQSSNASSSHKSGVKAVLRSHEGTLEELDAAYLICAEGSHSIVRSTAGLQFEGNSLGNSYALADVYLEGDLPDDELSIFTAQQGFMAVFPMGGRHFRFMATDAEKHSKDASDPTLEELQTLYNADSHIPVRLRDMKWSSRFRVNSRMLHKLRDRHIFFGGDSAHVHSPAGGQGMNTGIQDMINLSWKLALVLQGKATQALLDTYEEERLPVIRNIVKRTETATEALNSTSKIVHQLITHIAPVLLDAPFVQDAGTRVISEVAANYRSSSLSQTQQAHSKLRAGDRVPDVNVALWSKGVSDMIQSCDTRLYELLDPSRFTLLVIGGERTSGFLSRWEEQLKSWIGVLTVQGIEPVHSQPEAKGLFEHFFGVKPSLLLVRPDSYLSFVGEQNALPTLTQWFELWFNAD